MKTAVLVTGANGQLGQSIQSIALQYPMIEFLFRDKHTLDITNSQNVSEFFKVNKIDWCINCAAYTAVDKAEINQEQAYQINVLGARNIAKACQKYAVKLIHISTDFVFDGTHYKAYTEKDAPNPLNVYGQTKLDGEKRITSILDSHFILRTSWLYSEFGQNFLHTMLNLAKERKELSIVDDQISTPTYAGDLAKFIMHLVVENGSEFGLYNYSNEGVASWYDFAKAIFAISAIEIKVKPISSIYFPAPANRPNFSVLDTTKVKQVFNLELSYWRESLNQSILSLRHY